MSAPLSKPALVPLAFTALLLNACGNSNNDDSPTNDSAEPGSASSSSSSSGFTSSSSSSSSSSSNSSSTSSSSSSSGGVAREVSELDWSLYSQPGVWRARLSSSATTIEAGEVDFDVTVLTSIEAVNATTVEATDCFDRLSETLTADDFMEEDGTWLGLSLPDDDANEPAECPGDYQERYFVLSNDHYRIDAQCDGKAIGSVELKRISNTPGFDLGRISVNFDSYADVDTSDGVCGEMSSSLVRFGAQDDTFSSESISVTVPYRDSFMSIQLSAHIHALGSDNRLLSEGSTHIFENGSTGLSVMSPVFETEESGSEELLPMVGSATILHRDELSVQAEFELTTPDGENIQGEFSFSLE